MTQQWLPGCHMRLLMTVDAIGGVWRYAMDLAAELRDHGVETVFACLGPAPSAQKVEEAEQVGQLVHLDAPLDWLVSAEDDLSDVPRLIAELGRGVGADVLHLNLPSQAAEIPTALPVLAVSHSCVVTWFAGVRRQPVPPDWLWQQELNRRGFERADVVVSPSHSHARMVAQAYGSIPAMRVIHNGSRLENVLAEKTDMVLAAGRWWDDVKNGRVLDAAAAATRWPVILAGANEGPGGQYTPIEHAQHKGELSYAETTSLMRRARIVVSPSVYEPFGLAALEAARAGAALVLSDIETYRELWDGCACFADPDDPEAFIEAINRLADDADLRAMLAVKAYERSLDFTIGAQGRAMAEIYAGMRTRTKTFTAAE